MPGYLNIFVSCARDLPVMDRASELADAYVEVRFGNIDPQKSGICRRTLNPVWNHNFRLETNDLDLQNEPLEIRVIDWDTITSNDQIGAVLIDLDPLVNLDSNKNLSQITGWFPLYDTLRGIRGEVHVTIAVHFFGDSNPFRDSSAGLQFFTSTQIPSMFELVSLTGLVDALTVAADPEYHFLESFRTPRSSNDARQKLIFRLSNQLRRIIGNKGVNLGANAIVGYRQCFDLENHTKNIVARAIGTACIINPCTPPPALSCFSGPIDLTTTAATTSELNRSQSKLPNVKGSDLLNNEDPEPTGNLSENDSGSRPPNPTLPSLPDIYNSSNPRSSHPSKPMAHWLDRPVQLITLTRLTAHSNSFVDIAGLVTAKSIKLLTNQQESNLEISTRETWWTELREEVRTHAKNLHCSYVFGYKESATIYDDLIILSVIGTAGNLDLYNKRVCRLTHLPYPSSVSKTSGPDSSLCSCSESSVPDIMLSTIDPPSFEIPSLAEDGGGKLIQAYVIRTKKKRDGEVNASLVSEALPFIEFDIHRQLLDQMLHSNCNAIFGLNFQIALSDEYLISIASGTGFNLPWMHSNSRCQKLEPDIPERNHESSITTTIDAVVTNETKIKENESWSAPGIPKSYIPVALNSIGSISEHTKNPNPNSTNLDSNFLLYSCAPPSAHIPPIGPYCSHQLVLGVRQIQLTPKLFGGGGSEPSVVLPPQTNDNDAVVNSGYGSQLGAILQAMYTQIALQYAILKPCILVGLSHDISMIEGGWIQIRLVGTVMGLMDWLVPKCVLTDGYGYDTKDDAWECMMNDLEEKYSTTLSQAPSQDSNVLSKSQSDDDPPIPFQDVQITSLSSIPYTRTTAYLGRLSLTFVKEITEHHHQTYVHHHQVQHPLPIHYSCPPAPPTSIPRSTSLHSAMGYGCDQSGSSTVHVLSNMPQIDGDDMEGGGMGTFVQVHWLEIIAILNAHVRAMKGNAMVAFTVDQSGFYPSVKGEMYAIVCLSGDVCHVVNF